MYRHYIILKLCHITTYTNIKKKVKLTFLCCTLARRELKWGFYFIPYILKAESLSYLFWLVVVLLFCCFFYCKFRVKPEFNNSVSFFFYTRPFHFLSSLHFVVQCLYRVHNFPFHGVNCKQNMFTSAYLNNSEVSRSKFHLFDREGNYYHLTETLAYRKTWRLCLQKCPSSSF